METWKNNDLYGEWLFTYKIDGINIIVKDNQSYSKLGNKTLNINKPDGQYEIYTGDWGTSISIVRATKTLEESFIYSLDPIDKRLYLGKVINPTKEYIQNSLLEANNKGYEGLVLRQNNVWIKVKPITTYDLPIIGILEGKGKHTGRMGALITALGKVGTGFTDLQREYNWQIGQIIEISSMGLTPNSKLRFPRFIRLREDK